MVFFRTAIVLVVYTVAYCFFLFASLRDGHGTFLFVDTIVPWPLFAVAFMLIPLARKSVAYNISRVCVVVYYIATAGLVIIEQSGEGNFERSLHLTKNNPYVFGLGVIWFFGMQVMFWSLLSRSRKSTGGLS